jgi:cupin fold WbuC family metalloprotein
MTTAIFRDQEYYAVDAAALQRLKEAAYASASKRSRICLHATQSEPIQQMLIAMVQGHPVGPLRQTTGRKTYCAVEGVLRVTFYNDDGTVEREVKLSTAGPGPSVITFPASAWQSCEAETAIAIYLEIQPGPFDPLNTEWRQK